MIEYVLERYDHFGGSFKVESNVSNFATKTDLNCMERNYIALILLKESNSFDVLGI